MNLERQRMQLSQQRDTEYQSLKRGIRNAALVIVIIALSLAALCDILSVFDLGWIVSWTIPVVAWFITRRINGILHTSTRARQAMQRLQQEERVVRQRLIQALPTKERSLLPQRAPQLVISSAATSYVARFIRDTFVVQGIELIPIVDILPLYLGQVVKMIIDQRREARKAHTLLAQYTQVRISLEALEHIEIQWYTNNLFAAPERARRVVAAPPPTPQTPAPQQVASMVSLRDIALPVAA